MSNDMCPEGLLVKAAEGAGYVIKRNTLRSQLWHRKNKGDIENVNGRWRFVQQKSETPDEDDSPGASVGSNGQLLPDRDRPSQPANPAA